jgi:hypothetical protein
MCGTANGVGNRHPFDYFAVMEALQGRELLGVINAM